MMMMKACHVVSIFGIILLLCVSHIYAGGCNLYGHSCWGGHGKRAGNERLPLKPLNGDWLFSRLTKPNRKLEFAVDPIKENVLRQFREKLESLDANGGRRIYNPNFSVDDFERQRLSGRIPQDLASPNDNIAIPDKFNLIQMLEDNAEMQQ